MKTYISPALARKLLKHQKEQRPLSESVLKRFGKAMLAGSFNRPKEYQAPITFNREGQLIDGFHRLHAAVKTNIGFEAEIVYEGTAFPAQEIESVAVEKEKFLNKFYSSEGLDTSGWKRWAKQSIAKFGSDITGCPYM